MIYYLSIFYYLIGIKITINPKTLLHRNKRISLSRFKYNSRGCRSVIILIANEQSFSISWAGAALSARTGRRARTWIKINTPKHLTNINLV